MPAREDDARDTTTAPFTHTAPLAVKLFTPRMRLASEIPTPPLTYRRQAFLNVDGTAARNHSGVGEQATERGAGGDTWPLLPAPS